MDVHREFAQLRLVEDGLVREEGRIGVTPEALRRWAADLRTDDKVALEATGNSDAIANLLMPIIGRVVVSTHQTDRHPSTGLMISSAVGRGFLRP